MGINHGISVLKTTLIKRYTFLLPHLTTHHYSSSRHHKSQQFYSNSTDTSISFKDKQTPEITIIMPYNRDEVVASVTKFYDFLTTHLHFYPSELESPPPDGWSQITSSRFSCQRKSDTVINLLRHLPYLPGGDDADKFILELTVCADYTDESVSLDEELSIPEIAVRHPWDKLHDSRRREHIVLLGFPKTVKLHLLVLLSSISVTKC